MRAGWQHGCSRLSREMRAEPRRPASFAPFAEPAGLSVRPAFVPTAGSRAGKPVICCTACDGTRVGTWDAREHSEMPRNSSAGTASPAGPLQNGHGPRNRIPPPIFTRHSCPCLMTTTLRPSTLSTLHQNLLALWQGAASQRDHGTGCGGVQQGGGVREPSWGTPARWVDPLQVVSRRKIARLKLTCESRRKKLLVKSTFDLESHSGWLKNSTRAEFGDSSSGAAL